GGGCVEKEVFYETCAARGLMVFQDFFFACGQYPEAPAFLDEITTEIQDIILRLRVHPAIAAWCGDNERDMIDAQAGKDINENPVNKRIIPQTLNALDSQHRYYHTSSPSGGDCPRSEWQGDRRNWGPWHPDDNYAHIRLDLGRFISEGGNYALPNRETVRAFIPPSLEWPLTRKTWRLHTGDLDFAERRFDRLNTACWAHFADLKNLDQAIEVSQFAQGLGMSRLAEHCRIRKGECGGVVLWKINDCWPSVDSGLIDYSLQPRAGLAAIAQAYEPVAIAMENPIEGEHTSEVEIWGLNGILADVEGHLKWQCWKMTDSGFDLDEEQTCPVSLPANASTLLCRLPIKTQRTDELAWTAQLQLSDGTVRNTMYSLAPRTIYHLTQWQATGEQLQEAHTL
ncbi:MAG: hypothetical protein JKX85_05435, partial [Phycisphaeraceae bacterium]|nr:hypothetical protein [Phycisphaeraceae bacterium]